MSSKRWSPILLALAGCLWMGSLQAQELNTLTARQKAEGWKLLFNGHNLQGWHSYLEQSPGKAWGVDHGSIVLNKTPKSPSRDYADLVTNQEFGDFDLRLEWKLKPCTNSGIMFYVHEAPQYHETYETGPEMQVVDRDCSPDSKLRLHRAGVLYDLVPVDTETVTPGGIWNRVEIISYKGHLRFFLNGVKVVDTHLWDAHWKYLIAHSKFKDMPNFGTFRKGHISFQGTEADTQVWYRNIRIRPL